MEMQMQGTAGGCFMLPQDGDLKVVKGVVYEWQDDTICSSDDGWFALGDVAYVKDRWPERAKDLPHGY
jgi:hypothetical protein